MSTGKSQHENEPAEAAPSVPQKKSLLKAILLTLTALVAAVVVVVASQPSTFRISRAKAISAPPEKVFALVNDFHNWTWNPWSKIDPAMKQTYEGDAAGVGAAYTWSGNNEVGEGRMTIIESQPGELVRVRLEFLKPLAATHIALFTFHPAEGDTTVTWTMTGENSFLAKAIHLVMNMDQMIGGQFEKGLTDMKALAEANPSGEPGDSDAAVKEEAN
jgi:hypothetical protein